MVDAFLEGKTLAGTLEFNHPGRDGAEMIGAYAQVEYGGLAALVQVPKSVAFSAGQGTTFVITLPVLGGAETSAVHSARAA